MILVDHQIRARAPGLIQNFDERFIQPASYDLRIGKRVYAPPRPDEPHDLSRNGGAYLLPSYGTAVLETFEDLTLPTNLLGRIGLKSSFARRGLMASTGPQIDPGFEGKLFISLFNVSAASHVLKYQDTFLTIEFHSLEVAPEQPYRGEYQGKYTIGAEVMEALARLEGLTLSDMQVQFTELLSHVKAWRDIAVRADEFMREMKQHTRVLEQLTDRFTESQSSTAQERREVSMSEAMEEIVRLFKEKGRLYYSDIAEALHLDFATVIAACEELERQGLIEPDRK